MEPLTQTLAGGSDSAIEPVGAVIGAVDSAPRHVWDEATRPDVGSLVELYETAWRTARTRKPSVDVFLRSQPRHDAGTRLALLRADMALRWEVNDRVRVEWYLGRAAPLDDEQVVALAYEEFCLSEEHGEQPRLVDYYERFPNLVKRLKPLFEIHDLVGSGSSTAVAMPLPDEREALIPGVGETLGGFVLHEELGRGSFARVFRAAERRLANRPVAVKIAWHGTPEPQVLARLQHTHIVPIHSYRTDASTGLQILCMPFYGRTTLGKLLADDRMKLAMSGSDILAVLDSIDPEAAKVADGGSATFRQRFAGLSFGRAIALWGARLAEALNYAHDCKVLHGDIKPSNVLITPDAMPMLLDFNLAHSESDGARAPARATLGGTFSYMAPEQLEALADSNAALLDARSDIFSLGVVLYEAMGALPFTKNPPPSTASVSDVLRHAASQRRAETPRLNFRESNVSRAFEAVVRKCLSPEINDRYLSAAALAEDLQALADGEPLKHAREPLGSRLVGWVRRNRVRLTVATPILLAAVLGVSAWEWARINRSKVENQVRELLATGRNAEYDRRPDEARRFYLAAEALADGYTELEGLRADAHQRASLAEQAQSVHQNFAQLMAASGPLRFALMGFAPSDANQPPGVHTVLRPFHVLENPNWRNLSSLSFLEPDDKSKLIQEVDELLFFHAVAAIARTDASPELLQTVSSECERALVFSNSPEPWRALRECAEARRHGRAVQVLNEPAPSEVSSAWTCLQWGLIHRQLNRNRSTRAARWLDRSVSLDPTQYWAQYFLGWSHDTDGRFERALAHYNAAIALDPKSPWALMSRAHLSWRRGEWEQARIDLDRSIELAEKQKIGFLEAYQERGVVRQRLGDFRGAREDYARVLEINDKDSRYGRWVRANRAIIDFEEGDHESVLSEYGALLSLKIPDDERVGILAGRVRVLTSIRDWAAAEADLKALDKLKPNESGVFVLKAELALARGQAESALELASRAQALESTPVIERLHNRAALAAGRVDQVVLEDPKALWSLPGERARLRADVNRALSKPFDPANTSVNAIAIRAVLLAAIGDNDAVPLVEQITGRAPQNTRIHLIAARVFRSLGDAKRARLALDAGFEIEPNDPRLIELRGLMFLDAGQPKKALSAFDEARRHGSTLTLASSRARALAAIGDERESLAEWTEQIKNDPEEPTLYIDRARIARKAGLEDQSLADLEFAISLAERTRPDLFATLALEYALGLVAHPERAPRVAGLAMRALASLLGDALQPQTDQ